jgi:tRNA pseudouridine(55) synthase
MVRKQERYVFVNKQPGETPLEALERYRATRSELKGVPMTYAGRLDPMAEGTLLVLIGEECKNKKKYLGLDKEYEVEVLFGVSTDTHDALGLAAMPVAAPAGDVPVGTYAKASKVSTDLHIDLNAYVGKITQEYPAYSSKTVDGVQLHELARAGELPDEMPTKDVEIYSIEKMGERTVSAVDLKKEIFNKIALVRGDFRQEEIKAKWSEVLDVSPNVFNAIRIKVKCSSGTYMRSLADRMGKDAGTGALALSIRRSKIFMK